VRGADLRQGSCQREGIVDETRSDDMLSSERSPKMIIRFFPAWITSLLCLFVFVPAATLAANDGKALFEGSKCSECHSIAAEGVAIVETDDAAAEEDPFGAEDEGEKEDAPDLSGIGKKHNAEWIASYLQKKVKTDKGKKHPPRFRGSADKLKALSEYLAGLEAPAPAN